MIRSLGCRTATTRSNGNHSSFWMYSKGARARAKTAPLSEASTASGIAAGRGGICARGPQAEAHAKTSPAVSRPLGDKLIPQIVLER